MSSPLPPNAASETLSAPLTVYERSTQDGEREDDHREQPADERPANARVRAPTQLEEQYDAEEAQPATDDGVLPDAPEDQRGIDNDTTVGSRLCRHVPPVTNPLIKPVPDSSQEPQRPDRSPASATASSPTSAVAAVTRVRES